MLMPMSNTTRNNLIREDSVNDSHPYKNVPPGKGSLSYYQHVTQSHQLQTQSSQPHFSATANAQRANVWTPNSANSQNTPPTPDDEILNQLSMEELIGMIERLKAKNGSLVYENSVMNRDMNHHLANIQQLRQQNNQLMSENNELRNLCGLLEDERSRCRTLAREWQQFGNHMSRVMSQEVNNYSNKLSQLEGKQFELVRENLELKQLCLLLDNALSARSEKTNGSANHSPADSITVNSNLQNSNAILKSNSRTNFTAPNLNDTPSNQPKNILNKQILEYIQSLEERIQHLENERKELLKPTQPMSVPVRINERGVPNRTNSSNSDLSRPVCPQPLVKAMKVLRIQEQLLNQSNGSASNNNSNNDDSSIKSSASLTEITS